jgi:adenylylsulfate kinase
LYKKARAGEIKNFTGISDPYEAPIKPELSLDTNILSVNASVAMLVEHITQEGVLKKLNSSDEKKITTFL